MLTYRRLNMNKREIIDVTFIGAVIVILLAAFIYVNVAACGAGYGRHQNHFQTLSIHSPVFLDAGP